MTKSDFTWFTLLDIIARCYLIFIAIPIALGGLCGVILNADAFSFFALAAGLVLLFAGIMAYKQKMRKVRSK